MTRLLLAGLLTGWAGLTLLAQAGAPRKVVLSMDDQFERRQNLANHAGEVVVLLYGDRQGMANNKELGERIHLHYNPAAKGQEPGRAGKGQPVVRVIPVVCLGKPGNLLRNVIRNQVRKTAPETPVWLDFDERMREQFGLTPGVPNLAVVDATGHLRYHTAGEMDAKAYDRLIDVIDSLRKEAAAK